MFYGWIETHTHTVEYYSGIEIMNLEQKDDPGGHEVKNPDGNTLYLPLAHFSFLMNGSSISLESLYSCALHSLFTAFQADWRSHLWCLVPGRGSCPALGARAKCEVQSARTLLFVNLLAAAPSSELSSESRMKKLKTLSVILASF